MAALQELLNVGLVDIGADDARFEKLELTVSDLKKLFAEKPQLLVTATLIALDEDVSEDEPLLVRTEELLIQHWRTMRNTHVNRPRQLLRAILVEALEGQIHESPEAAGIIWYTAASPIKHAQTKIGKGSEVIHQLVQASFQAAEGEAVRRTQAKSQKKKGRRKKADLFSDLEWEVHYEEITKEDVIGSVGRALGPNLPGVELTDPTPSWPNSGQSWSHQSAPRLAEALVSAVNLGSSNFSASLGGELKKILTELAGHVEEIMRDAENKENELSASRDSHELRVSVLWWAKALYSPFLGRGYRDLESSEVMLASVLDLNDIVPILPPNSVAYVLGEVVQTLTVGDKASTLSDYLEELGPIAEQFREKFDQNGFEGRRPLLSFILGTEDDGLKIAESLCALTGVDPKCSITREDLAMWMFRDMQALRLVKELS